MLVKSHLSKLLSKGSRHHKKERRIFHRRHKTSFFTERCCSVFQASLKIPPQGLHCFRTTTTVPGKMLVGTTTPALQGHCSSVLKGLRVQAFTRLRIFTTYCDYGGQPPRPQNEHRHQQRHTRGEGSQAQVSPEDCVLVGFSVAR